MILGGMWYQNVQTNQALYTDAYVADTARNFNVYANRALAAYDNNQALSGVIPAAAMNLPTWYQPLTGLTAFIGGGHVFVFQSQANAAQAGRVLARLASGNAVTGICQNGTIYSAANQALIAAPVGIPNNAVVEIVL